LTAFLGALRLWKLRSRIRQLENRLAQSAAGEQPRVDQAPR
jgi:hypothetical protein